MIAKITAIGAAAVSAVLIVTVIPGLAPDVAASAPEPGAHAAPELAGGGKWTEMWTPSAAGVQMAVAQYRWPVSADRKLDCAESWPYYETSCLHDGRHADGKARLVRIVSTDRAAQMRPGQTNR